jgi:hydroxymethylbilane synthase
MTDTTIKIGTRGSKLALWQAQQVKTAIEQTFPELTAEIVVIKTKGDIILDVALSKIGDKGLFTKEIETALLNNEVDIAVHSLKDLPTELPDGLTIGGTLPRGEVRDVFISRDGRTLEQMTANDRIATSSLRRKAQLLNYNGQLTIVDIRGNVDTRLQKLADGVCDALVMAGAGLLRLGYDSKITQFLDPRLMLPAVSQGAVAIQVREDDDQIQTIVDAISHDQTWQTAMAERCLLRTLEGGCQVPVGCYSEVTDNSFTLTGMVASVDGKTVIRKQVTCPIEEAPEAAIELAQEILNDGGAEILSQIRPS